MGPWRFIGVLLGVIGFFGGPGASQVSAQTVEAVQQQIDQLRRDFDALKQQYGDRLTALEARLATIQGGQGGATAAPAPQTAQVPAGAEGAGGPTGTLPIYGTTGAAVSGAKVF